MSAVPLWLFWRSLTRKGRFLAVLAAVAALAIGAGTAAGVRHMLSPSAPAPASAPVGAPAGAQAPRGWVAPPKPGHYAAGLGAPPPSAPIRPGQPTAPPSHVAHGGTVVHGSYVDMCGSRQHMVVQGLWVVRNDNFGGQAECVEANTAWSWFKVTRSDAVVYDWQAYPEIFRGCEWGVCSPHSAMPVPVSRLVAPTVSWKYVPDAPGRWNAAVDLWFNTGSKTGPYDAEIMVWLGTQGIYQLHGAPVYHFDGSSWQFAGWRTHYGADSWNYLQFRRAVPTDHVSNLDLEPFIKEAEAMGLVQPSWSLDAIDAGFEIVQGGTGLQTKHFSASP